MSTCAGTLALIMSLAVRISQSPESVEPVYGPQYTLVLDGRVSCFGFVNSYDPVDKQRMMHNYLCSGIFLGMTCVNA